MAKAGEVNGKSIVGSIVCFIAPPATMLAKIVK